MARTGTGGTGRGQGATAARWVMAHMAWGAFFPAAMKLAEGQTLAGSATRGIDGPRLVAAVTILALVVGSVVQWRALPWRTPAARWWAPATLTGILLGALLALILVLGREGYRESFGGNVALFGLVAAAAGGVQWLVLRRIVGAAAWWIAASAVGGAAVWPAYTLVVGGAYLGALAARGTDGAAIAAVATQGAASAGAYAAVTAAALFWLVRRPLGTPSPVRTTPCADARRARGV